MKAYERLLKYAVIKTPSDESSDSTPSSACQFDLANLLKKEMEKLEKNLGGIKEMDKLPGVIFLVDPKKERNAILEAKKLNIPVKIGNVYCQDRFYDEEVDLQKLIQYGCLAVEMETSALYMLAARYNVQALGVFTVSNHLFTGEETTAKERLESIKKEYKKVIDL